MTARILYVHNYPTHFVKIDLELLRGRYLLREWYQVTRAVNIAALVRAIAESDLVFGWFASWHTFWPTLLARGLKRPVVLVVGGYDTANMPAIHYGSQRGGFKRWVSRTTMHSATALITNSSYIREEVVAGIGVAPERINVVYHGLDATRYPVEGKKEKLAITAGHVNRENLHRKGLEPFVRAAALLREIPFVVIGAWRDDAIDYLRMVASPNVQFTGWVQEEALHGYFGRASVYVQASMHEGFGLAVAEAMLSECIPVVTRAGALPEVVGDAGVYIGTPEPAAIADGVQRALQLDDSCRRSAQQRIVREFPLAQRRQGLYDVVEKALR